MWPDRVSNPRPLALESDVLPNALRGPVQRCSQLVLCKSGPIKNNIRTKGVTACSKISTVDSRYLGVEGTL